MSCLNPTEAWQDLEATTKLGKHPVIFSRKHLNTADYFYKLDPNTGETTFISARYVPMSLPCGKCILCRKARAWEITIRALLEKQAHPHDKSCFVTLTCDDKNIPSVFPYFKLRHKPWQDFAKRLRKRVGQFRFLMCGEYGEKTKRPHYHAVIFGLDLTDRQWSVQDGAYCDSPLLREIWGHGHIMCRSVNDNAIAYVAGYELKLDNSEDPQEEAHVASDEVPKNYVKWSRRPGLGYDFMEKFNLFRTTQEKADDGFTYQGFSPSVIYKGKLVYFDGRYYKKQLEKAHTQWTDREDLFDVPTLPLHWSEQFDILQSSKERRVLLRHLHSTDYAEKIKARNLENKAKLLELELARKLRDVRHEVPQ